MFLWPDTEIMMPNKTVVVGFVFFKYHVDMPKTQWKMQKMQPMITEVNFRIRDEILLLNSILFQKQILNA